MVLPVLVRGKGKLLDGPLGLADEVNKISNNIVTMNVSLSDDNSNMQFEIDNLKKVDKDIFDKIATENEDLRNKVSLVDQDNQDQNKIIDALENSIKEQQLNIVNLHETTNVFQEQAKYVEAVEAKVAKVEELRQKSANDSKNDLEKAITENKNHIDESITNILIKINALNDQSDTLKEDTEKLGEVIEDIQDKLTESKTQFTEEMNVFQSNIHMSIKADQKNNTTAIESTLDHLKDQMKKFEDETERNNEKLMIDIKGGDNDLRIMIGDLNSRLEDEVNKISNNMVTMSVSVNDGNSNMQIEIDNLKKADKDIAAENEDLKSKVSLVDLVNQDQNKIIDALENSIKEQQLNIVNLHETTNVFQEQAKYVKDIETKVVNFEVEIKKNLEATVLDNKENIEKLRVGIDEALNDIEEKFYQANVTSVNELNIKIHDLNTKGELKMSAVNDDLESKLRIVDLENKEQNKKLDVLEESLKEHQMNLVSIQESTFMFQEQAKTVEAKMVQVDQDRQQNEIKAQKDLQTAIAENKDTISKIKTEADSDISAIFMKLQEVKDESSVLKSDGVSFKDTLTKYQEMIEVKLKEVDDNTNKNSSSIEDVRDLIKLDFSPKLKDISETVGAQ